MVRPHAAVLQVAHVHEHANLPKIDLPNGTGLDLKPKPKGKLGVILLISIIFSLISVITAAIFAYFYLKPEAPIVAKVDPGDSSTVKKVEWVALELPASYLMHPENTDLAASAVYQDDACKISATIEPTPAELPVADGEPVYIKDTDEIHNYEFASQAISQDVNAPGANVSKLVGVKVFKAFNYQLASLAYMCKSDAWDAKKTELEAQIMQFMVKTERVQ